MAYASKPDDFASRKVIVNNLSPVTKQEDIIIHFQRRGNGGGEVDSVHMLNERAAVVTFEKSTGKFELWFLHTLLNVLPCYCHSPSSLFAVRETQY